MFNAISRRALFFVALSVSAQALITVDFPKTPHQTDQRVLTIQLTSSLDKGFYLVHQQRIPIRRTVTIQTPPLNLGNNPLFIGVLDEQLVLQSDQPVRLDVYRSVFIRDVSTPLYTYIVTELARMHQIQLLDENQHARMDAPIVKRNMYAILMWFVMQTTDVASDRPMVSYDDMVGYTPYRVLYANHPVWLPRPIHGNFYPNAYITRQELVNVMDVLVDGTQQGSTSMHLTDRLTIPDRLAPYLPSDWTDPLAFVTPRDVISAFQAWFDVSWPTDPSQPSSTVTIDYGAPPITIDPVAWLKDGLSRGQSMMRLIGGAVSRWHKPLVTAPRIDDSSLMSPDNVQRAPANSVPVGYQIIQVRPGDSIQKIARRHYGQASKWPDLVELNGLSVQIKMVNTKSVEFVHIVPGQSLMVPASTTE